MQIKIFRKSTVNQEYFNYNIEWKRIVQDLFAHLQIVILCILKII